MWGRQVSSAKYQVDEAGEVIQIKEINAPGLK
jgi:hypothetical protein